VDFYPTLPCIFWPNPTRLHYRAAYRSGATLARAELSTYQGGRIGLRVCRSGPHDPHISNAPAHHADAAAPLAAHRFLQRIAFFPQDTRVVFRISSSQSAGSCRSATMPTRRLPKEIATNHEKAVRAEYSRHWQAGWTAVMRCRARCAAR